jgi:glutamate formiminotransferase/formiminotetrahydrofolate cyclodeaminase
MKQLIECVPNFSEGNNLDIIKQITQEIEQIDGVKLLNVDPGKATNRTVVTFVGEPHAVVEAAYCAIKKAGELIDMGKHKGEHPRMGLRMFVRLFLFQELLWKKLLNMLRS